MLFNADIWRNFTLEKVNLEKKKIISKRNFQPKVEKNETKFYGNPELR